MNLKKIKMALLDEEELVFNNYKKLCEFCEIEVKKGGKSKQLQMQKIESILLIEKIGRKIHIKDILIEEYDVIDVDTRKDSIPYREAVNSLILHHLVTPQNSVFEVGDGLIYLSPNMMFEHLKLVNQNYRHAKNEKTKYSILEDIPIDVIDEYFNRVNRSLCTQVESCLNTLKNKSLVSWTKIPTVCTVVKIKDIDENGKIKDVYKDSTHRKATKEEIQKVLKIEKQLLDEIGCKFKSDLIKIGKWVEFRSKSRNKMIEELNISYMYDSYEVIFNKDQILEEARHEYELNPELFNKYSLEINNGSIDRCISLTTNRIDKYPNKLRTHEDFMKYYKKITENLMLLGLSPIKNKLKLIENTKN